MKKIILSFMFLMLLSLVGCGGKKSMIYLYNFKPESNDSFKEIAQIYKEKTVEFSRMGREVLDKIIKELDD